MKAAKTYIVLFFLIYLSLSCRNTAELLPKAHVDYLENYHCWPYDVKVFSISDFNIDSLFYKYPLDNYFKKSNSLFISKWKNYQGYDSSKWSGMKTVLAQCDNNEIYMQLKNKKDIYFSGSYRYLKNLNGEKLRDYEIVIFLNLHNKKMHIFKNVNKVY